MLYLKYRTILLMKETDIQTSKLDRERDRQTYMEIDRHREIERERVGKG